MGTRFKGAVWMQPTHCIILSPIALLIGPLASGQQWMRAHRCPYQVFLRVQGLNPHDSLGVGAREGGLQHILDGQKTR